MTKARSVSFLNAFKTMAEAEDVLRKIADPGMVIHLWNPDRSLYAVCTQPSLDSLQQELDQAKKDKQ